MFNFFGYQTRLNRLRFKSIESAELSYQIKPLKLRKKKRKKKDNWVKAKFVSQLGV